MEENIKTNDWFASRLLNNDKGAEGLLVEGINPLNSTIQSPEFYKNKAKVKEIFTKEDGNFDEERFNQFYTGIAKEFEYLSAIDSEKFVLDYYDKSSSNFTTDFGKVRDLEMTASFIENPLVRSKGFVNPNEWSEPTLSNREAAQRNQFYDPETGKWSEKTVNEGGIWGLLKEKSLAYATYDEDVYEEINGKKVKVHEKGEWKTDEFGNYYTEKAGNRENLGKRFVTWSEVLTDDSSAWNKIDIFDSDDLNSNIPKTVARAALTVGSFLIPFAHIGDAITYTTAAVNFARVLPQIAKTLNSLFSEDVQFDKLNSWDNYMRKFGRSTSDYAAEHFLSIENILDMATDSFMQLKQQRLIADIPRRLGMFKKVDDAAGLEQTMRLLTADSERAAFYAKNPEMLESLVRASATYRNVSKYAERASKVSDAISKAYLITTSTEDTYNMAREYGFDTQSAAMIALGTYAGIGMLFQTDYFRGMLANSSDYELQRDIKILVKKWLENSRNDIIGTAQTVVDEAAKVGRMKKWAGDISKFIQDHITRVESGRFGIIEGAINEAVEEVMEEVTQDVSTILGNQWTNLKSVITGKEYDADYDYFKTDPLARYGSAAFGGALGGAIFKMSDRLHFQKQAWKNWQEMLGKNSEISKELVRYISQGKKDLILREIDKLEATPFMSKEVSAFNKETIAENETESQNYVLFNSFRKAVNDLDSFMSNNNLEIDYEQFGDIELIKGIRAAWINSKGLQNSLFEDYLNRTVEISKTFGELQSLRAQKVPNMESSAEAELDKKIMQTQQILDNQIEQVRNLVQGRDDSYIGRLMLESNREIMNAITPTTKEAWARNLYNMEYENLPSAYQSKVDEIVKNNSESGKTEMNYVSAWNVYKQLSSDTSIKNGMMSLQEGMRNFSVGLLRLSPNNGSTDVKVLSGDKPIENVDLFETMVDIIEEMWNKADAEIVLQIPITKEIARTLAYKILNLNMPLPDYYKTDILTPEILDDWDRTLAFVGDETVEKYFNDFTRIFTELKEKIKQNPKYTPSGKNIWNPDSTDDGKIDIYSEAGIGSIFESEKAIADTKAAILAAIHRPADINTAFNPIETFDTSIVIRSLQKILELTGNDSINIEEVLRREQSKINELRQEYRLSEEGAQVLETIKNAATLFEAVISGSDSNFRTTLMGVSFGANNYLNQAFAEKGLDLELLQMAPDATAMASEKLQLLIRDIKIIRDYDKKNKAAVITQEKQISLKDSINKLAVLDWLKKITIDGDDLGFIKDGLLDKFEIDYSDLPNNISDDEYVALGIKYRDQINNFERAFQSFYKSLDPNSKVVFTQWLADTLAAKNPPLFKDPSLLSSKKEITFFDRDLYYWLMAVATADVDLANKYYKGHVDKESQLCPFDSQEEIITTAIKFIFRENKEDIDIWIKAAENTWKDETKINTPEKSISRGLKIWCSGGTGKSEAIIPAIYSITKEIAPNKPIYVTAFTERQCKTLKDAIGNIEVNTVKVILDAAKSEEDFKLAYKDSVILIDEATNVSSENIDLLEELAKKYNIDILYFGDDKQHGVPNNLSEYYAPSTRRLVDSKRALLDVTASNSAMLEKFFEESDNGAWLFDTKDLQDWSYYEDETILAGIKFSNEVLSKELIENFIASHNIAPDSSILILVDNADKLSSIITNEFKAKYPNIEFATDIESIQGVGWNYVISDYNLTIDGNTLDREAAIQKLKDFYTIFTRHKIGLLQLQPIQFSNLEKTLRRPTYVANENTHNIVSKYPPVSTGLTPEAIAEFKDFKLKVLNGIQILDTKAPKTNPAKPTKVVTTSIDTSYAEATPGYRLKAEFTPEYIKELMQNEPLDNYPIVRNTIYQMLFDRNAWESKLPKHLQGGEFRIKVFYAKTDHLYNLGNEGRDNKDLDGVHPWIVYHVNGVDVTLGMFHNTITSIVGGLTESKALKAINELADLVDGEIQATYYKLDLDKIKITRGINPIAIQNNESNDPNFVNITYKNGKFTADEYNYLTNTAAFYFVKGNQSFVKVNDILDRLYDLRHLYADVFKELIDSGLYNDTKEFNDILELIGLDRKTWNKFDWRTKYILAGDQSEFLDANEIPDIEVADIVEKIKETLNKEEKKKFPLNSQSSRQDIWNYIVEYRKRFWDKRGVPNADGRFCSFITLNTGKTVSNIHRDLQEKSDTYLRQLEDRIAQLQDILSVAKSSDSDSGKKTRIKEILSKKPQWEVSLLVLDNDFIEDKEQFDKMLGNIDITEHPITKRNLSSYNTAIKYQIALAFQRISNLLTSNLRLGDNPDYFNKSDLDELKRQWGGWVETLYNEFVKWRKNKAEDPNPTKEDFYKWLSEVYTFGGDEISDAINKKFTNSRGENILKSDGFSSFLKFFYFDSDLSKRLEKSNGLKNSSNKNEGLFPGHFFGQLLQDNGFSVLTQGGNLVVINSGGFQMKSKVIQLAQINVHVPSDYQFEAIDDNNPKPDQGGQNPNQPSGDQSGDSSGDGELRGYSQWNLVAKDLKKLQFNKDDLGSIKDIIDSLSDNVREEVVNNLDRLIKGEDMLPIGYLIPVNMISQKELRQIQTINKTLTRRNQKNMIC